MPKRVVDGDAVWRSKKLKQMHPQFRAEYANLVPLAEANGVFEVDADRIWSDVYSYNRDEITVETVEEILSNLEEVGLLRVWEEGSKVWGYWEGIHKSGRLPKASELLKYKNLPPNPPPNQSVSGDSAEGSLILAPRFGIGLVLEGYGLGAEPQELNETNLQDEDTDMKAEKEIQKSCQNFFGKSPRLWDTTKEELKRLEGLHKGSAVVRAFEGWADSVEGDLENPVAAFVKVADSLLRGESNTQKASKAPEVLSLTRALAYVSDGKVAFGDREKPGLLVLSQEFTQSEIESVFKAWLEDQDLSDPIGLKFAGKNFVDRADALCYTARRKRQEKSEADAARAAAAIRLQEEAEAERAAAEVERVKEAELFDPLA